MNTDKLIRVSSITKKLLVGLFGAFLLVFLLFHMSANLLILAKDGGDAYSAFCHFMGSNIIVKIFEIGLLACFVLHMCLSTYLWFCNRRNRPVNYHKPSRTKTAKGSKLAIVTGSLLLVCILFHFYDFFFVKTNLVKGQYMVTVEELYQGSDGEEMFGMEQQLASMQVSAKDLLEQLTMQSDDNMLPAEEKNHYIGLLEAIVVIQDLNSISKDRKWIRQISAEQRDILQKVQPKAAFEPDFYAMARQKFSVWHIVLCYLVFFFLVGLHIRHGFESAFQTFGLNHYKYSKLVQVLGIIYCWVVCLGFAIVPIGVYFGL